MTGFGAPPTPLAEAIKAPDIEEFTEEQLALINLGIDGKWANIWNEKGPGKEGKKIFKYGKYLAKNLTKGFLDWFIDRIDYTGLKQVDLPQLEEGLADMVITTLDENRRKAVEKPVVDKDLEKQLNDAFKEIAKVQAERDELKELSKVFISIFAKNELTEPTTPEQDKLIKELMS